MRPLPNRLVAYAIAALSLVAALLPVLGNFDWTSTGGVIAGLTAVVAIAYKWLEGWQLYELRTDDAGAEIELDDDFDEDDAVIPPAVTEAARSGSPAVRPS